MGKAMDLDFKQQSVGETVYLVFDIDDACDAEPFEIDTFAMNMMAHNRIANIVQAQIVRINEKRQLQFNITGLAKLNGRISMPRPKREVLGILNSILNAFEEVDAYMLDMNHLFLDWEYIYMDGQENCMLMYLPFDHGFHKDKIEFLQEIVGRIQPDFQEKDPYLFDIMNAFSREAIQKLSDFREIIKKSANAGKDVEREEQKEEILQQEPICAVPLPLKKEEEEISGAVLTGIPRGEDKAVKKSSDSPRIPLINIPGKGPKETKEKEAKEKEAFKVSLPGKKKPEKKAEKMKPEKKKKEKAGIFKKSSGKQNVLSIPKKRKAGESAVQDEVWRTVSRQEDTSGVGRNRQSDMYEEYEMTEIIKEPPIAQNDGRETIILEQTDWPGSMSAGLTRKRDGTFYRMDGNRTAIGSSQTADICVYGNGAISRIHAVITFENGNYYIEDNKSKNGSFIGESRLPPGTKRQLSDGMVIRLANEDFEFSKD